MCLNLIIWGEFKPVVIEEMDRVLGNITGSSATYTLNPCPSWLIKASWEMTCGGVQAVIYVSL